MKLNALTMTSLDEEALKKDYQSSREIGVIRIGEKVLFFRSHLKVYYVPYREIRRFYRRVLMVPARLCCGRGSIDVENLVLEGKDGELAQIQLPGTRAAKELMEVLKARMPGVPSVCPARDLTGEASHA